MFNTLSLFAIVHILHKIITIIRDYYDVTLQNLFYVYFDIVKFTGRNPPEYVVIAEVKKYFENNLKVYSLSSCIQYFIIHNIINKR